MNILAKILERKRERIAEAKKHISRTGLMEKEYFLRTPISLRNSLERRTLGVIAEMKKASPSKGLLRQQYDPVALAEAYTNAGAAALSVLTEEDFFFGSLDHLCAVRATTTLPLLRKDFILDSYQLTEALAYGADAVLFIAAALDPVLMNELLLEAKELGLEVLVEIHSRQELEALPLSHISLLGINNRDLTTFVVDIATTIELARSLPSTITIVSESGITSARDIAFLHQAGIKNYLIGEAFMRSENPGEALAQLLKEAESLCL